MEAIPVHIRWMIRRDLPAVIDIARLGDRPWGEDDFAGILRKRSCIGMVCERGELIVGFMVYANFKHHIHLLNIGVHPVWRRHSIGAQMVTKLLSKLSSHRRRGIATEVRERNLDLQLFLRSQGFRAWRVLRDYFEDGEDAYMMERHVADAAPTNRLLEYEEIERDAEERPI